MVSEASLPLATVFAFLMVLARVSGAFIFVPIPGIQTASQPVRAVLSLSLTMALFPLWPAPPSVPSVGLLIEWLIVEAAVGLSIGLVVGFLAEAFGVFGQMVGLHSGHSFASTVDPNTQADSGIFVVLGQSIASLLFFATGLHRNVIAIFAKSLQTQPPGMYTLSPSAGEVIIRLSATIFSTGFKLALPLIALLVMVDLAIALLSLVNAQLQLNSLAFPAKILVTLAFLAAIAAVFPQVYTDYAGRLFSSLPAVTTH
ncbi:MAG: flagellar biosynthetic protein FliR [Ignavibacteriota bacterium]